MTRRTVFITGSRSGRGRAAARLFSARGWKVIATMRNTEKEKELADLAGVVLLPLDITQPAEIERAAATDISGGGVDVLFNNAGYGMAGPPEGVSDEQILRMGTTQPIGAIRTTKAFISHFREKRVGVFLHTNSIRRPITRSL